MSVELLTIGSNVGKTLFPVVAKELIAKFNSVLNPTDLEKALKAGINAAEEWDTTQPSEKHLFYHWASWATPHHRLSKHYCPDFRMRILVCVTVLLMLWAS